MYSHNVVMRMNEVAHRYRPLIHQAIHAVLKQPRYYNTGAGAASLAVDVVDGDTENTPVIQIMFDDHLILMEKRKMMWTKWPDMEPMVEWAQSKTNSNQEAKRLAWGTAYKQKNFDTWKAKPWRKKSLSGVLKEMNKLVLEGFDQAIEEDLQQAVKG